MAISPQDQIRILARRCERIHSEQELIGKLTRSAQTSKPLRIKLGMDPTAPDVTLGHAVPLKVIRQFQEWGHKAVLIIGDYTARVGDPSGRNTTRPELSGEQIDANAKTYVAQVGKILLTDPDHLEVRYNGEWLARMSLVDIIKLASRKTLAQVLEREDFANRFKEHIDIRLHEILYPLLQGWDSVQIQADVEMGGSDQLVNNLVGREFQKEEGQDPQVVIVTPLLVGTDGTIKMSKSKGNYIGVTEPANEIFGKVMRVPDKLLESYYTLLTDLPPSDFESKILSEPRNAKVRLARMIVAWLHGEDAAAAAQAHFEKVIVEKEIPDEMPELRLELGPQKLAPLMVKAGLVTSNSEAIRKIKEGAVRLDGEKVLDHQKEYVFEKPVVLQMGNRRFARLVPQ
ncbi:MAG TPA: tyrosine--tRNA ligase [Tepidisphaeraceae bacterium]|nr:tyrosine--tRNA ligase [Tepidisphaeraceae bacterium]